MSINKLTFLIAFSVLFGILPQLQAQTVYIGTGTSGSSSFPVYPFYNYYATESVYLSSEIGVTNTDKSITKLGYYKTSGSSTTPIAVKIYMKTTAANGVNNGTSSTSAYTVGAGFSDYMLVFDGNLPNNATSGMMEVSLSTPFLYTSGNLSVLVVGNTYISSGRPNYRYNSTGTPYKRASYSSDTVEWSSAASMTAGSDRPHIQLTFATASACSTMPVPGNTVASVASACLGNSFTLSLQYATAGTGVSYQWQSSPDGNIWTPITGATSMTLSTAQNSENYYRCVVSCSGFVATSNPIVVGHIGPVYATLPVSENFESWSGSCNATNNIPGVSWLNSPETGNNSWRRNDQGAAASWTSATTGAYSPTSQLGSYSARFHSAYVSAGGQGILDLYVDANTSNANKRLTFYYINADGSDKLEVLVSTDGGVNFTKIGADILTASSWTLQTRNFVSNSGQTIVRLRATSDYGLTDMGIDNLRVEDMPSCLAPTNVTTDNVSWDSATLHWVAPSPVPANGYEYYHSANSLAPTAQTQPTGAVSSGTSDNFSNLNSVTTYYVWVRSVCSLSEKSEWSVVASFTTACAPVGIPYYLNFDNTTAPALPTCIASENTNADSYVWKTYAYYKHSAPNSMYLSTAYTSNNDYFFTEKLNLEAGTTYRLSFKYLIDYSSSYRANISVAYGSEPISTAEFTSIVTLSDLQGISGNTQFTTYYTDFTPVSSGVYYLSFRGQGQAGIYLDDIGVELAPSCVPPQSLTGINITTDTANVLFTVTGSVPAGGYEYYLSTANTPPTAMTTATAPILTGTSMTLQGLISDTNYYIWVRSICAEADKSEWSGLYHFFTGYCAVSTSSSSDYITAFSTTAAEQNVNYATAAQPSGSYSNQSAQLIEQSRGLSFDFSINYESGGNGTKIWIDWNNDLIFSESEVVFYLLDNNALKTGTIFIPETTAPGNYRMRVRAQWGNAANPSACGNLNYGSTVDFTLKVTAKISWTGTTDTNWNTAANWTPQRIPSLNDAVVIRESVNNPVIFATAKGYAKSLTLLENAVLLVKSQAALVVDETVNIAVDEQNQQTVANLTLENEGYLNQIQDPASNQNIGSVTVKRNSTPMFRLEATGWASPVSNQKLYDFAVGTFTGRIYEYNETSNNFDNTGLTEHSEFVPAKGYSIRAPNNYPAYAENAVPVAFNGIFYGKPNNGTVGIDVTANNLGFNYIGNPYPSPVDAAAFMNANQSIDALYFWTHEAPPIAGVYAQNNYASYNSFGGTQAAAGAAAPDGILQVGQGFVAKMSEAAKIEFANSMRIDYSNGQFFRPMTSEQKHRIWLNLSAGNLNYNQIMVGYSARATMGIDPQIDAKMFGYSGNAIYSLIDNEKFVIQGRSLPFDINDVIPLGVKAVDQGMFSINIDHADGLFEGQSVYVKDLLLDVIHNLSEGAYHFASEAGTFNNRFELVYQTNVLSVADRDLQNHWVVYKEAGQIQIKANGFAIENVEVYDLTGRLLFRKRNIDAHTYNCPEVFSNEVLLVKLNGSLVKKIR